MAKCSFCGYDIARGTGKIFVKKDGKKLDFCSSKCEVNMVKHKKKARNLKWTKFYEKKTNTKKQ
jgi:large subunit ribosomal protein L24e